MRFGTDGVRGVANKELTPEFALVLGRATARVLGGSEVLFGLDTRRSGTMIAASFAAGVCAEGLDVISLGVIPTPGVAHSADLLGCAGAMISASHNPFPDNGLKLFAPGGLKLTDAQQQRIESEIDSLLGGERSGDVPTGLGVGEIQLQNEFDPTESYRAHLRGSIDGDLAGMSVVLDTANGAASIVAPSVFRALGAEVVVINNEPDGTNINVACGSTDPAALRARVTDVGADLGFAFDGDADRVMAVTGDGELLDGDQIMAILAVDLKETGRLATNTVVATVMSNLGFRRALAAAGIDMIETPVGDRHVLETMVTGGHVLGGEQSGHLIISDRATTGDGVLAAVTLADVVRRSGRRLSDLAGERMERLPQVLVNVRLERRPDDVVERIADEIDAAESELGDDGRVLIRLSGTEPLVRVMVEATSEETAQRIADSLGEAVSRLA